jgi:apolipoprotein N-acyltransferase
LQITIIIISALLYGLSYWHPAQLWWGTLASTALLFMLPMRSSKIAFIDGILWGTCAYSLHLYGIITGIVTLAAQPSWLTWLPGIFLVVYLAVATGFLWMVGMWCEQQLSHIALLVRIAWLWLYWLWITYGSLFFCGHWEGYLLMNPLLPWAAHPQLLWSVSWFGVIGATLLLCMLSALIAYAVECKHYFVLGVILLLFWINLSQKKVILSYSHCWYNNVKTITTPIIATAHDPSICIHIAEHIACAHARNPNLRAIIFPESCIYPWRVCAESLLVQYVPSNSEPCDYIIGSFYDDNGLYRNSCYWLRDGILQKRYDKRHAMPLIERLPWFLQFSSTVKNLFFNMMPEISPSENERPPMQIGDTKVVPYICSELFINRTPDDHYPDTPIVALINDRWAPPYLQNLIYLGAVLQSHAWQREIFYVSYTRCSYIDPFRSSKG